MEQNKQNFIPPTSRMTNYAVLRFGDLRPVPNVCFFTALCNLDPYASWSMEFRVFLSILSNCIMSDPLRCKTRSPILYSTVHKNEVANVLYLVIRCEVS